MNLKQISNELIALGETALADKLNEVLGLNDTDKVIHDISDRVVDFIAAEFAAKGFTVTGNSSAFSDSIRNDIDITLKKALKRLTREVLHG